WPLGPVSVEEHGALVERLDAYMLKAVREAKVHTSWINPEAAYERAVHRFVTSVLDPVEGGSFLDDLRGFLRQVGDAGLFAALSQALLKLTCPGVPDLYQGTETWDLSLVDPDNRRPVDYARRCAVLAELQEAIGRGDLTSLTANLLANISDGRIKTYLVSRTLEFRRTHPDLFTAGSYLPVESTGAKRDHVCAFARTLDDSAMIVVVPRLGAGLARETEQPPIGPDVWGQTSLLLPSHLAGRSYGNIF